MVSTSPVSSRRRLEHFRVLIKPEPMLPTRMLRSLFLQALVSQAIVTSARDAPLERRAPDPLIRVIAPLLEEIRKTVSPLAAETRLPRSGVDGLIDRTVCAGADEQTSAAAMVAAPPAPARCRSDLRIIDSLPDQGCRRR